MAKLKPLLKENILLKLNLSDFKVKPSPRSLKRRRFPAPEGRRPRLPTPPSLLGFERHVEGEIRQPSRRFLDKLKITLGAFERTV